MLDEAQNTTPAQMKMFLTRMGYGAKVVITGDPTQTDLPPGQRSGLRDALELVEGIRGIGIDRVHRRRRRAPPAGRRADPRLRRPRPCAVRGARAPTRVRRQPPTGGDRLVADGGGHPGRPGQRGRARPADGRAIACAARATAGSSSRSSRSARGCRCCSCSRGPRSGRTRRSSQPHLVRARSGNYGLIVVGTRRRARGGAARRRCRRDADLTALAAPIVDGRGCCCSLRDRADAIAHADAGRGDRARARALAPRERHADLDRPRAVAGARHPVAARDHPAPRVRGHERRRRHVYIVEGHDEDVAQAQAALRGVAERLAQRPADRASRCRSPRRRSSARACCRASAINVPDLYNARRAGHRQQPVGLRPRPQLRRQVPLPDAARCSRCR